MDKNRGQKEQENSSKANLSEGILYISDWKKITTYQQKEQEPKYSRGENDFSWMSSAEEKDVNRLCFTYNKASKCTTIPFQSKAIIRKGGNENQIEKGYIIGTLKS